MSFAPIRKTSASAQVAESIRDAVLEGSFHPGDPLPSERELAGSFGVNRSTVREALHRLSAIGLVEIRHGEATRVQDYLTTTGLQLLPLLLMPKGVPDVGLIGDLLAVRGMVLGWTARQAALGAGRGTSRLGELLAELERAGTTEQRQKLDYEFFHEMVQLTGNRVLGLLANPLREVYEAHREMFAPLFAEAVFDASYHRRAYEAIAAGRAEEAAQAMAGYARSATRLLRESPGRSTSEEKG